MPASAPPNIRVVVRVPYNRPEHDALLPRAEVWTPEKADTLWKVIERSRSTDNGGTDWKGLAAHLEVPLPYLLYRVHARFQEELRGLQDIPGVSSPSTAQQSKPFEEFPFNEKHAVATRAVSRLHGSGSMSPSPSGRLSTPLGVRARLNSLGNNSPRPKKATSSSTLTVQGPKKAARPLSPTSPASSEGTDSEDEEAKREEEADRNAEEQETLNRKLQELQQMVTNDALGLVSRPSAAGKGKGKEIVNRGRIPAATTASPLQGSFRRDSYSSPLSVSSAGSAQDSIPDIPSPPPDSQSHSPISRHLSPSSRHLSPNKSSSPPALSPRSALGQSHRRYGPLIERNVSEQGSNQGSEASSFSDISDTSLSASALESALMSNIRGNGSRL
ncbi:Atg29-N domain-containing protein [Mycena sanguinolenta]|uniref:Autophagy-related protein 29 n=1 Tax=Mycena sanguinolenta TaxID=230812 RepID=A0A8H7CS48_9AGAR|nr:Atg29-N domain-containing protein [Mycena sanguinolenta]